jgi:coiled-coil domain-containing protein 12
MSSTHTGLDAASIDRKARLAKLASLKRKQPESDVTVSNQEDAEQGREQEQQISKANQYISGRNYDVTTKGAKLGFENAPNAEVETLEQQADRLASAAAEQAAKEEAEAEKGIDLFKLQPKKPNWDLKRDLAEKMKILDVRTHNAIAKLVRERIENAKREAMNKSGDAQPGEDGGQGEEVGMEGNTLVESIHLREQEEEKEDDLDEEEDGL